VSVEDDDFAGYFGGINGDPDDRQPIFAGCDCCHEASDHDWDGCTKCACRRRWED